MADNNAKSGSMRKGAALAITCAIRCLLITAKNGMKAITQSGVTGPTKELVNKANTSVNTPAMFNLKRNCSASSKGPMPFRLA